LEPKFEQYKVCSAPHFLGAETALVMKRVTGGFVAC
jgi:hypothetical protein